MHSPTPCWGGWMFLACNAVPTACLAFLCVARSNGRVYEVDAEPFLGDAGPAFPPWICWRHAGCDQCARQFGWIFGPDTSWMVCDNDRQHEIGNLRLGVLVVVGSSHFVAFTPDHRGKVRSGSTGHDTLKCLKFAGKRLSCRASWFDAPSFSSF